MSVTYDEKKRLYKIKGRVRLPNGKYRDYNRAAKWKRKKDAIQEEINIRNSLMTQEESMTFKELVSLYVQRSPILNIKESTLVSDESYYINHLADFFDDMDINSVTSQTVEVWKMEMVRKRQPNGKLYSATTINNAKKVLSKYFSYAERLDLIPKNPCKNVPNYTNPNMIVEKELNFLELDEFKQFISYVDDERMNLLFTFLFMTGLREGEMTALTWHDIDFDAGTVTINKTASYKTKQKGYTITPPKTKNSIRTIGLTDTLLKRLESKLEHDKQYDGFSYDWFIFGSYKPIARTTIARELDKYINISGVKRITPHGFRHSHASMLIKMRIDDSAIADRLGHTVNELRKTYAHVYESDKEDLISKLNKIL